MGDKTLITKTSKYTFSLNFRCGRNGNVSFTTVQFCLYYGNFKKVEAVTKIFNLPAVASHTTVSTFFRYATSHIFNCKSYGDGANFLTSKNMYALIIYIRSCLLKIGNFAFTVYFSLNSRGRGYMHVSTYFSRNTFSKRDVIRSLFCFDKGRMVSNLHNFTFTPRYSMTRN